MGGALDIEAFVLSCSERGNVLAATLESLAKSDFDAAPEVVLDDASAPTAIERIHHTWRRVIRRAAEASSEFVLLLEDDLVVNRWLFENLASWPALQRVQPGGAFFASLYNPNRPFVARRPDDRCLVAEPRAAWGAQALLTTPRTARFIDSHWDEAPGNPDQRMPRLAGRVTPVYFHSPSLVDHAQVPTTWGGIEHSAADFDPDWRAAAL